MIVEYVRKGGSKKFMVPKTNDKARAVRKRSKNCGGCCIWVLVAIPTNGTVRVGWSLCNFKAGDYFDKETGLTIASGRAQTQRSTGPIAQSLKRPARSFIRRIKAYYKDKEIKVTFNWNNKRMLELEHVPADLAVGATE